MLKYFTTKKISVFLSNQYNKELWIWQKKKNENKKKKRERETMQETELIDFILEVSESY